MADETRARARWIGAAAAGALTLALVLVLAAAGHESTDHAAAAVATALWLLIRAGSLAAGYLLSGMGWGRLLAATLRFRSGPGDGEPGLSRHWLQAGLGISALLWFSHVLGVLGLLSGPLGMWVAWAVVAIGIALLVDQVLRGSLRPERWPAMPASAMLSAPGLALLLVAACNPPMGLWRGASSEGGGYDALSYHLQLPKEWASGDRGLLGAGRLWPLEHNVYSFLPSYTEAAYLHIAAMSGAGRPSGGEFVAGEGVGVIAAQFLHAGLGLLTALMVARIVWRVASGDTLARLALWKEKEGGAEEGTRRDNPWHPASGDRIAIFAGAIGAACVLATPWVTVVGSLAYNELAVTALLATALLGCLEPALSLSHRAIAAGLCAGLATSAKPTAAFMAAPVIGVFLLAGIPARHWPRIVLLGSLAGIAAVAPWLIRNWTASGNPVFPFASSIFGTAHWSDEQMARYSAAHAFGAQEGGGGRLARLFSARYGLFHHQWALLFPIGAAALLAAMTSRSTRRVAVLLGVGVLIQLGAWMFFTHLQPRFLLPLIVPVTIAIGLAVLVIMRRTAAAGRLAAERRATPLAVLAPLAGLAVPLSLAVWSGVNFLGQNSDLRPERSFLPGGGAPCALLASGVAGFTGHDSFADLAAPPKGAERFLHEHVPPAFYVNWTLQPDESVYLLGGATPLYFLPAGGTAAVVYHTTWDRSPLGDAVRRFPGHEAAWTRAVAAWRPGRLITHVLVDFDELDRLSRRDGWYDPVVTPELVRQWLSREGRALRVWPGRTGGTVLFRLNASAGRGDDR